MPIEGKLGSLYVDKEQTQPLFPRTKTKAITDDDNIRLDIILDSLKTTVDSKVNDVFVANAITEELNAIDFPVDSVNGKTGNVQLSAVDVGAAPAGFGWGDWGNYISLEELNLPRGNGRFVASSAGWASNPFPETIYGVVDITGIGSKYAVETLYNFYYGDVHIFKRYYSNTTKTWELEWENPPMVIGQEYRTTERQNGKPVYVKCLNLGNLANNSYSFVEIGSTFSEMVDVKITARLNNRSFVLPMIDTSTFDGKVVAQGWIENTSIMVLCVGDRSAWTATAVIKYTKD